MNLCIDIGNSTTKVGFFENNKLNHFFLFKNIIKKEEIERICNQFKVEACIICSTAKSDFEIIDFFTKKFPFVINFNEKTKIPIKNRYQTPETLGKDRLAAIVGASFMKPDTNILVVDAGTAVTFDFIDNKKNYFGGAISPGLSMRFEALNKFTARLPLMQIPENQNIELIGNNTENSIVSGVINGIINEIDGYICALKEKFPELFVCFTGGNSDFLVKKLKNAVHQEEHLVLKGLNQILEYNISGK